MNLRSNKKSYLTIVKQSRVIWDRLKACNLLLTSFQTKTGIQTITMEGTHLEEEDKLIFNTKMMTN